MADRPVDGSARIELLDVARQVRWRPGACLYGRPVPHQGFHYGRLVSRENFGLEHVSIDVVPLLDLPQYPGPAGDPALVYPAPAREPEFTAQTSFVSHQQRIDLVFSCDERDDVILAVTQLPIQSANDG